jgi:(2Fe-2S) ferredoxin
LISEYYQYHVFFCTNDRGAGAERPSCNQCGSAALREYAKVKVKELDLAGPGKVRINTSGCLDRCEQGPALVIYPEGTWYTFIDEEDIDEIIEQHLVEGRVVERLLIDP